MVSVWMAVFCVCFLGCFEDGEKNTEDRSPEAALNAVDAKPNPTCFFLGAARTGESFSMKQLNVYALLRAHYRGPRLRLRSLSTGCAHSGMDRMVKESWKIFKSMKKDWNVNLTADHNSCMIDIIGRARMLTEAYELDLDSGMCVLHSNIYAAKANVRTSLSALHIEETSDVMGTSMYCTGSGGLKNLADDVGGSKRRSISEPDSVLCREWALHIGRTSAAMGNRTSQDRSAKIKVLRKWAAL
ncbi:hypothetical protein Tco_0917026 [Tanacetum coccineum]